VASVTGTSAVRPRLTGRGPECAALDRILDDLRAGRSATLLLRGGAGIGKTALLEHLAERAGDCRVARVVGVQAEIELPYAGLHQLCAPLLEHLDALPEPQAAALRAAFGLVVGPAPDRFRLGLAVLGLLSEVAAARPLLCLIDDHQWLDHASAQVVAFVARRLDAEAVGLVFASRLDSLDLADLPLLVISALSEADAQELLRAVLPGRIDTRVRDQIIAEAAGNPLALLELPRGLSTAELAGGFALPSAQPLESRLEESFRRRADALPVDSRRLLLLAAADPTGDPVLLWRTADTVGIDPQAPTAAIESGLVTFAGRVVFRHPLVRSAVYRAAPVGEQQAMHRALAEATDPATDPDRRAWHRARAATGPDEDLAAELVSSAERARARGGVAAAAAFLQQAATLTLDRPRRVDRALAAAGAKLQAGAFEPALALLGMAEADSPDHRDRKSVV
jgi:hypothetical protein